MPMIAPGARQPAIRRLWPWAVLVTAAVLLWRLFQSPGGRAESPTALPVAGVVAATTQRRDVHVEIKGIGLVQAYNTVTVKPRINGQITQIVFTEGKAVHAGDILARIDSRFLLTQLHQAQANSAKDEAQLENAKRELTRLTDALVKAFVSRQLVDGQQSQVAVLEATVRADAAAIENARIQLDYATITAPIDGIAGMRMVDVGNVVATTDPGLVVITQVNPIAVVFTLPADVSADLPLGEARRAIPVEVFDREERVRLAVGRLALVDNQIDRTTNTVRLKAIFDNADGTLRPGQFVNAHVLKTELHAASTVARSAVQYNDGGAFVWLIRADMTVEPRRIALGPQAGELVVIDSGLAPGDRVVIDGQYNLHAGLHVRLQSHSGAASTANENALSIP
jgi:multidrug efflux system membrane fusion protein